MLIEIYIQHYVEAVTLDISFTISTRWEKSRLCHFQLNDRADIWRIEVSENVHLLKQFAVILNQDEIARANRYLRKEDHDRFIISRGALRLILSGYIHKPPEEIDFQLEPNRKPYIPDSKIQYNLSDSGNQVLIAVSRQPVGIDVEYIKPKFYYDTILPLNFNQPEIDFISEANSSERFFMLWTRKEAILKATGIGLTDHLKLIPSLDGAHLMDGAYIATQNNWKLCSFMTTEEYMATIATYPAIISYNLYEFNHEDFFH